MRFEPEVVAIGDRLPDLVMRPVDRTMLALFAGASGDHHPIHIDLDYAREAGHPDVFAHGMLVMAWLGRLVTQWAPQWRLRQLGGRFTGITALGDIVTCTGVVAGFASHRNEPVARLALLASDQSGQQKIVGEALVSLTAATEGEG